MRLFFLNDIPIRIILYPDLLDMGLPYDFVRAYQPKMLAPFFHAGHVLLQVRIAHFEPLLNEIIQIFSHKPKSISILLHEEVDVNRLLQQYFKLTQAAGGIVIKGKQVLMIYRFHRWDLPKGGVEVGETMLAAATREVAEECGVKAMNRAQFYTTWHAFQIDRVNMLKETTWYTMDCIDDTHMAPQKEEAIERVVWIDLDQLQPVLENTYMSISLLLRAYQNYITLKKT